MNAIKMSLPAGVPLVVPVLALLASWVGLYQFDIDLYFRAIWYFVPERQPDPFIDSAYLAAQLECWRQGVDVYFINPCDLTHRVMAYPPFWLRLGFIPADPAVVVRMTMMALVAFVAALGWRPRRRPMGLNVVMLI